MKIAVVGSPELIITNFRKYLPKDVEEIIIGSSRLIDSELKQFADKNSIKVTEISPDYKTFGKHAPLKRSLSIIESAPEVIVFWDGISGGMKYIIDNCIRRKKKLTVHTLSAHDPDIRIFRKKRCNEAKLCNNRFEGSLCAAVFVYLCKIYAQSTKPSGH